MGILVVTQNERIYQEVDFKSDISEDELVIQADDDQTPKSWKKTEMKTVRAEISGWLDVFVLFKRLMVGILNIFCDFELIFVSFELNFTIIQLLKKHMVKKWP